MTLPISNRNSLNVPTLHAPAARPTLRLQSRSAQVESVADTTCYDTIIARYPGMDSASKAIVKILCDDQVNTFDPGKNVFFSDAGLEGMRDALEQNLNLQTLTISNPICLDPDRDCIVTLANALGTALKVNRGVQTLAIEFIDSSLATQAFLSNVNCFNLSSLIIQGTMNTAGAKALSNAFSQKFPLTSFTYADFPNNVLDSGVIPTISNGIANNNCLKYLDFERLPLDLENITTLFKGIGSSKIENFIVPIPSSANNYAFSDPQKTAILQAVQSNPCFLKYSPFVYPFPSDLAASIQNITQGRTPCPPDPQCAIAQSCATPIPPSPASNFTFTPFDEGLTIGIGSTVAAVSLVALGVFLFRKCRTECSQERQPLLIQT